MTALLAVLLAVPVLAGSPSRDEVKSAQMLYLKATLLQRQGRQAEALKAFKDALETDPESPYICREAAELALDMGQLDEAHTLAKRAVAVDPKGAASRVLLGRVLWAGGRLDAAREAFEAALKLDPASAESIFSLGSLLAAKDPDRARVLLEHFLAENPARAAEVNFHIAKIEVERGRLKEAEARLKAVTDLEPDADALPIRYALAQAYELKRDTEAALAQYLEIMKSEPGNPALLDHIGEIQVLLGRWDEARGYFEQALALNAGDPAANHWLALEAERRGDYARAAELLARTPAPAEDPGAALRLSYYLSQAGRLKDAVLALDKARRRWPKNDQVTYFLALGYEDLKDEKKAVRLLREVVELKPDYRDARYQLAVLLERLGDIKGAEVEFRALLARKSDDAQILNYLGYSLADRGLKLAEAEVLIRAAVRLEPANGAYLDSLGWVHYKQGRSTEAVKELLDALARLPEDESVWDHLGDAYHAAGSDASAWFAWKRAESLMAPEADKPGKAGRLEKRFSPEELGARYLDYLRVVQDGLKRLGALAEFKGEVLGKEFKHQALLNYKAPGDLSLELLGPMYNPLFRMRINAEGFVMDPLRLEGVSPDSVLAAGHAGAQTLLSYFSGEAFAAKAARYRRTWRRRELVMPGWRLVLDAEGLRVVELIPTEPGRPGLRLSGFTRQQGRQVAGELAVRGPGFSLGLRLKSLSAEFQPPANAALQTPKAAP